MLDILPMAEGGDGTGGAVGFVIVLGWIILGIAQLILFIAALVSILSSKRYTGGGKFLWVVVIFFAPLFGALGWFIAGRRAQIRTNEP
jgi:hypothetical protein